MPTSPDDELLARLALGNSSGSENPWSFVATTPAPPPAPESAKPAVMPSESKLNELLQRVKSLTEKGASTSTVSPTSTSAVSAVTSRPTVAAITTPQPTPGISATLKKGDDFVPPEPPSIRDAGLTEGTVEELMLKAMLVRGDVQGREVAEQIKLNFALIEPLLTRMKHERLVAYRNTAQMNDYVYQLTDVGRERARRYAEECSYCGSAPVTLADYVVSVKSQSLQKQNPTQESLRKAFEDLLINPAMLNRLGPAINSGRGMFLYGYPGNGKTSIAERVTRAFGEYIWIPRCIGIDGEIMRVYDPMNHEEAPLEKQEGLLDQSKIDRRWVRIRRPTIIVGGELTMENLEVSLNPTTGISESPVQLKSNCGTLVIDDFGRQRISVDALLNRWIVPLEKRVDYLNMASGKKVQVPFDQLVIFSTNLKPKDLVDDAFLRRIPYKIEVPNPSESEFRSLFQIMSPKLGFEYREEAVTYLIENYYKKVGRPFRCCQPRDLLMQVRNYCFYQQRPLEMTTDYFDFAVDNYFAVME